MAPILTATSRLSPAFGLPTSIPLFSSKTPAFSGINGLERQRFTTPKKHAEASRLVHMMATGKSTRKNPTIENRIARMRYEFLETFECGIELLGTEVKSVRRGQMNIRQGYGRVKDGELFLYNVHISEWQMASKYFNHDPIRPRRLLLHKRSIRKLSAKQTDPGLTIVPTRAYFNARGFLKVEMALARGKKLHDKREDIKRRDDQRTMQRIIKSTLTA